MVADIRKAYMVKVALGKSAKMTFLGLGLVAAIGLVCVAVGVSKRDDSQVDSNNKISLSDVSPSEYVDTLNADKFVSDDDVRRAISKAYGASLNGSDKIIADHASKTAAGDAKVSVVIYCDYMGLHCREINDYFNKLERQYGAVAQFVYRNFNLNYPNSDILARAIESAGKLGGFSAYKDMIKMIASDDVWVKGDDSVVDTESGPTNTRYIDSMPYDEAVLRLKGYANSIGLDSSEFEHTIKDYKSNGIQDKLDRDKALGAKQNVTGVPTVFVSGKNIGMVSYGSLEKAIDNALVGVQ